MKEWKGKRKGMIKGKYRDREIRIGWNSREGKDKEGN